MQKRVHFDKKLLFYLANPKICSNFVALFKNNP